MCNDSLQNGPWPAPTTAANQGPRRGEQGLRGQSPWPHHSSGPTPGLGCPGAPPAPAGRVSLGLSFSLPLSLIPGNPLPRGCGSLQVFLGEVRQLHPALLRPPHTWGSEPGQAVQPTYQAKTTGAPGPDPVRQRACGSALRCNLAAGSVHTSPAPFTPKGNSLPITQVHTLGLPQPQPARGQAGAGTCPPDTPERPQTRVPLT